MTDLNYVEFAKLFHTKEFGQVLIFVDPVTQKITMVFWHPNGALAKYELNLQDIEHPEEAFGIVEGIYAEDALNMAKEALS